MSKKIQMESSRKKFLEGAVPERGMGNAVGLRGAVMGPKGTKLEVREVTLLYKYIGIFHPSPK